MINKIKIGQVGTKKKKTKKNKKIANEKIEKTKTTLRAEYIFVYLTF
jgi:hypothetical protein